MAQLTRRGTIVLFANRSGKTSFFNGLLRPGRKYCGDGCPAVQGVAGFADQAFAGHGCPVCRDRGWRLPAIISTAIAGAGFGRNRPTGSPSGTACTVECHAGREAEQSGGSAWGQLVCSRGVQKSRCEATQMDRQRQQVLQYLSSVERQDCRDIESFYWQGRGYPRRGWQMGLHIQTSQNAPACSWRLRVRDHPAV